LILMLTRFSIARVAELADAPDLGSGGQPLGVRLPPLAPMIGPFGPEVIEIKLLSAKKIYGKGKS
jgi:hypothetical protein